MIGISRLISTVAQYFGGGDSNEAPPTPNLHTEKEPNKTAGEVEKEGEKHPADLPDSNGAPNLCPQSPDTPISAGSSERPDARFKDEIEPVENRFRPRQLDFNQEEEGLELDSSYNPSPPIPADVPPPASSIVVAAEIEHDTEEYQGCSEEDFPYESADPTQATEQTVNLAAQTDIVKNIVYIISDAQEEGMCSDTEVEDIDDEGHEETPDTAPRISFVSTLVQSPDPGIEKTLPTERKRTGLEPTRRSKRLKPQSEPRKDASDNDEEEKATLWKVKDKVDVDSRYVVGSGGPGRIMKISHDRRIIMVKPFIGGPMIEVTNPCALKPWKRED